MVGGNPFDTSSIYGLIIQFEKKWGIHYVRGGTGAIASGLSKLYTEDGGNMELGTEVEEILIENGKASGVRLSDGRIFKADIAISNADEGFTYKNLIPSSKLLHHH